ncbi:M23 family metallopeptidase [Amaricoccus solimangrovi]|uniref:LysM peptidoglycan-binding domain-containing M23 family metallopeptidase n=1 Tax=Amaricoccus solimangrovi TaxID=2589815 RepID=A0A501X106_9RHOB|nr:M23 family metallopeptidase [Amaricoccus solimangrovi]TPE53901.1 LysM peptidoglycan-binding domain-containing M23 family metallopeptidase [Amaricoccus solimangrovi]
MRDARAPGPGPIAGEVQGKRRTGAAAALMISTALVLSGCAGFEPFGAAPATGSGAVIANEAPDSRGVITYASYQVVVARDGDTIATVANRLGIPPAELGNRNSLPTDYMLRQGEILLLPDSFPRPGALGGDVTSQPLDGGWSPERASQAIDGGAATPAAPATAANPFQNGQTEPLIDPVRHRVESGETAYSIARLYGVSVTALASWNGLGPDLAVRPNQELLIPIVSGANSISSAPSAEAPGQATPVPPPPSASTPLPENIETPQTPVAPDLGQYRTPQGGRLAAPVTGAIARPYDTANPNGVGYAAAAGTPVKAAGDGEVALISNELGGQGSIVLIRHRDDLMTTYSTLANVSVKKGDKVQAGQVIGVVAPRDRPELQFDVFRGTTSVDPTTYLPK